MLWFSRHRLIVLAAICLFWTGAIMLVRSISDIPFLTSVWSGEQVFEDLMQREGRKTAIRPDFAFIGIDQNSLQFAPFDAAQIADNRALQLMAERPFPWSREVWSLFLDRMYDAGARLVMFDVIFGPPNEGDAIFRSALDRYKDKVVLGANFDMANGAQAVVPNEQLVPPPQMEDDRVGYVVFFGDKLDQKVRAVRYTMSDRQLADLPPHSSQEVYSSLAARALEKLGQADAVPRDLAAHLIRFTAPEAYRPVPLWELFDTKMWHANYADGSFFKNKVLIVGSSAQVVHDVVATPMDPNTAGPALHLQSVAAALDREFLRATPYQMGFALVAGAGFLAWLLIAFVRRPLVCVMLLFVIAASYLGVARLAYDRIGLLLLVVPPLTAFLLSGLSSLGFEYALERMEKVRTRRTLERYVSKNLVKEILDSPASYYSSLRGARKPATLLFSDLVGFTAMTERADPETLVRQLNEYLTEMVAVVFENGGTLDKFIGDAVMAVWGNVRSRGVAGDAKAAACAALGMREALRRLNRKWRTEGRPELQSGIGINQGDVLMGNIGSQDRMDPTVIGDSVNLASRLEALTRIYHVDILVGPTAGELIREDFHLQTVGRVQVRGKTDPVEIFALISAKTGPVDAKLTDAMQTYESGIQSFRGRDFTHARTQFSSFLEQYPDDELAKLYLARSLEYEKQPPKEEWNAVEVITPKWGCRASVSDAFPW
ncbi:MAG: CHASE2 domain-containing protein, partial [Chthoniobacterales bacterium]